MTDNKEFQLQEEVENLALSLKATVAQLNELRRDLEFSEWNLKSALDQLEKLQQAHDNCSQNLEVSHQANSEISKHNQELSKENERLKKFISDAGYTVFENLSCKEKT